MRWCLTLLVTSLFWDHLAADSSYTLESAHEHMRRDWYNSTIRPVRLRPADAACLSTGDDEVSVRADAGPNIRQECRTLSDAKWNRTKAAFAWLMTSRTSNGLTRYQAIQSQHRLQTAPNAHFGPGFWGWHRAYLLAFETQMKQFDPGCDLCYWDSSKDAEMPDASQSAVWTDEYFGNEQGAVTNGICALTTPFPSDCTSSGGRLTRRGGGNGLLYSRGTIASFYSYPSFADLMSPYDSSRFEMPHGGPHAFIGGHMNNINCSPTDCIFFMHHCFVDYIVEQCRIRNWGSASWFRYPDDSNVPPPHRRNAPATPMTNRQLGDYLTSTDIVPGTYSYAPSPDACTTHESCGGKLLWCNNGRCMGCVRRGGRMGAGWPAQGCYIGECQNRVNRNGVCDCA